MKEFVLIMANPSKLIPEFKYLSNNVLLGLSYALVAASSGITYLTFYGWLNKEKMRYGVYFQFFNAFRSLM